MVNPFQATTYLTAYLFLNSPSCLSLLSLYLHSYFSFVAKHLRIFKSLGDKGWRSVRQLLSKSVGQACLEARGTEGAVAVASPTFHMQAGKQVRHQQETQPTNTEC